MVVSAQQKKQATSCMPLFLNLDCPRSDFCYATITVPGSIVSTCFHEAAKSHQQFVHAPGFNRSTIPLEYVKENFKENILSHLKEFLFKYCVINFLYQKIREQKLVVSGEPRLIDIQLNNPSDDAIFRFEFSLFAELPIFDWKYLPFKAPRRKNYKDLDRQVETFIEEEKKQLEKSSSALDTGDWVGFTLSLADQNDRIVVPGMKEQFWFKLGDEEVENPLKQLFKGKKCGDCFFTHNKGLQDYFSDQVSTNYNFYIEIFSVVPYGFFCFDELKRHFRIKTNKDMHRKLIEVFSYRNDISQRRTMVEEALKLMLSKHRFSMPHHLVLRQQKVLYDIIKQNSDYNVYRVQKDFTKRVQQLAEKQARESIFIDKLAYHENIVIADNDIKSYLNLTNRLRTKEFIYFDLPSVKIEGQETPLAAEEVKRTCLREKAINHILYHLTKK